MYVYNVLVLGFSVGLTFDKKQAEEWASKSRNAVIERRIYRAQQETPHD